MARSSKTDILDLIVDVGNSSIKAAWLDESGKLNTKQINSSFSKKRYDPDEYMMLVPEDGATVVFDNTEYLFGSGLVHDVFITDYPKLDFYSLCVRAVMPEMMSGVNKRVRLHTMFHTLNKRVVRDIQQTLTGRHVFLKNDVEYDVEIVSTEVYLEGFGSKVIADRVVGDQSKYFALFDIGSNTLGLSLWEVNKNQPIFSQYIPNWGVNKLVKMLETDSKLKAYSVQQETIDKQLLVNSLLTGWYGDSSTGLYLGQETNYYIDQYKEDMLNKIRSTFQQHLNWSKIRFFTGGGAMLLNITPLNQLEKGTNKYRLCVDTTNANTLGVLEHVTGKPYTN